MARYTEITFGGSGGQGLVFISSFMAEVAMADGLNVVQTQSYGIAQRGGFVAAEVIMSAEEILFQQVSAPAIIIALHDAVGKRYDEATAPVIYDSSIMQKRERPNWYGLPLAQLAQSINAPKSVNLIAVGMALHFVPMVSLQAFETVCNAKFKPEVAKANFNAVQFGLAEAAKAFTDRR